MGLIDSHAHLTTPELLTQFDAVRSRWQSENVAGVITVATNLAEADQAMQLAARQPKEVWVAAAFHPHGAERVQAADLAALLTLWDRPEIVALGEMGLDYHYNFSDRAAQQAVFADQLQAAASRSKPVILHCREAFDDVIRMLLEQGFGGRPVVFHCFTGTAAEASRVAEHGWRISFTGIVTFPRSLELQAIAQAYPREAIMVETDSPYLAPVPFRGTYPNEPARLVHIARFLAQCRGESYEEFVEQTARNTREFFYL